MKRYKEKKDRKDEMSPINVSAKRILEEMDRLVSEKTHMS
jgi:hypothetical protein